MTWPMQMTYTPEPARPRALEVVEDTGDMDEDSLSGRDRVPEQFLYQGRKRQRLEVQHKGELYMIRFVLGTD